MIGPEQSHERKNILGVYFENYRNTANLAEIEGLGDWDFGGNEYGHVMVF